MRERDLTVSDAARTIGTDPAKVCAIMSRRLKDMSVERLIRYIGLLGRDVEIHVSKSARRRAGTAKSRSAGCSSIKRVRTRHICGTRGRTGTGRTRAAG